MSIASVLDAQQVETFSRDGYLFLPGFYSGSEIRRIAELCSVSRI
jgi:hypothetical protein